MNKILWMSTIFVVRSSRQFSSSIISSKALSYFSYNIRESRGFPSCQDQLLANYRFSVNNFCSESSPVTLSKCWNCNSVAVSKPFLACDSCRSVQPVDTSVHYFDIFGLKRNYGIDDTHLESKYKNWQKKLHPDLVHTKSKKEKEYAAEQSARVIDAYRTLQTPLLRALYLLRLEGVQVDEEKTVSEPELLAEMMEFREAVEEAPSPEALKQIQTQVEEKMEKWSKSFENAFENRKFEDAVSSIERMRYYHRIIEEITKKL